jgi:hypothetical protein
MSKVLRGRHFQTRPITLNVQRLRKSEAMSITSPHTVEVADSLPGRETVFPVADK